MFLLGASPSSILNTTSVPRLTQPQGSQKQVKIQLNCAQLFCCMQIDHWTEVQSKIANCCLARLTLIFPLQLRSFDRTSRRHSWAMSTSTSMTIFCSNKHLKKASSHLLKHRPILTGIEKSTSLFHFLVQLLGFFFVSFFSFMCSSTSLLVPLWFKMGFNSVSCKKAFSPAENLITKSGMIF